MVLHILALWICFSDKFSCLMVFTHFWRSPKLSLSVMKWCYISWHYQSAFPTSFLAWWYLPISDEVLNSPYQYQKVFLKNLAENSLFFYYYNYRHITWHFLWAVLTKGWRDPQCLFWSGLPMHMCQIYGKIENIANHLFLTIWWASELAGIN